MWKTITALGTTLALLAGCASIPASPSGSSDRTVSNTRFWLHPKLGMVRVNAATGAMVTASPAEPAR